MTRSSSKDFIGIILVAPYDITRRESMNGCPTAVLMLNFCVHSSLERLILQ